MEWIINNWFVLFFLAMCLGMHFMGGHGHHGKHKNHESDDHKGHDHVGETDGHKAQKGQSSCH